MVCVSIANSKELWCFEISRPIKQYIIYFVFSYIALGKKEEGGGKEDMYRYKKRLWTCEECGAKTQFLDLKDGKHVCGPCSNKSNDRRPKN